MEALQERPYGNFIYISHIPHHILIIFELHSYLLIVLPSPWMNWLFSVSFLLYGWLLACHRTLSNFVELWAKFKSMLNKYLATSFGYIIRSAVISWSWGNQIFQRLFNKLPHSIIQLSIEFGSANWNTMENKYCTLSFFI